MPDNWGEIWENVRYPFALQRLHQKLCSNYFLKPMKTLEVKYHSEQHKHRKI